MELSLKDGKVYRITYYDSTTQKSLTFCVLLLPLNTIEYMSSDEANCLNCLANGENMDNFFYNVQRKGIC